MKKLFYTFLLLSTIAISQAQVVPVEKQIDYRLARKGTPEGIYFKDINNLFDKFIGTWEGTMNNKNYTFIITKEIHNKYNVTTERLMMRHLITDLNGAVISDNRSDSRVQIVGDCFNKNPIFYDFFYAGENSKCGLRGQVSIRNISPTTLELKLDPNTEWFPYEYCPGGKRAEQILPTEYITLTKQ